MTCRRVARWRVTDLEAALDAMVEDLKQAIGCKDWRRNRTDRRALPGSPPGFEVRGRPAVLASLSRLIGDASSSYREGKGNNASPGAARANGLPFLACASGLSGATNQPD